MNEVYNIVGIIVVWGVAAAALVFAALLLFERISVHKHRFWLFQVYDYWKWKTQYFNKWQATGFTSIGDMTWDGVLQQIIKYQGGYNHISKWPINKHILADRIIRYYKEMADSKEGQKHIVEYTELLKTAAKNGYYQIKTSTK